jgi:hypothetical protein
MNQPIEYTEGNGRCPGCKQPLDAHKGWKVWPKISLLCPS